MQLWPSITSLTQSLPCCPWAAWRYVCARFLARQPLPHCWTNSAPICASPPAGALVGSYTAATPECILFFSFLFPIFSNSISSLFLLFSSMFLSLRSWICLLSVSSFIRISLTSFSNHLCSYHYSFPMRTSHLSPPLVFHHHLHLMAVQKVYKQG